MNKHWSVLPMRRVLTVGEIIVGCVVYSDLVPKGTPPRYIVLNYLPEAKPEIEAKRIYATSYQEGMEMLDQKVDDWFKRAGVYYERKT